jgi:hypothetical protein
MDSEIQKAFAACHSLEEVAVLVKQLKRQGTYGPDHKALMLLKNRLIRNRMKRDAIQHQNEKREENSIYEERAVAFRHGGILYKAKAVSRNNGRDWNVIRVAMCYWKHFEDPSQEMDISDRWHQIDFIRESIFSRLPELRPPSWVEERRA